MRSLKTNNTVKPNHAGDLLDVSNPPDLTRLLETDMRLFMLTMQGAKEIQDRIWGVI